MSSEVDRIAIALRQLAPKYGLEFFEGPPRWTSDGQLEYRCFTADIGSAKKQVVLQFPMELRQCGAQKVIDAVETALLGLAPVEARIEDLAREIHALGGTPSSLPIGQSFALTGRWRVYFNRHGASGRPWCVAPDAGGWEVAVSSVSIATVAETVYRPKDTPDDEDGRPSAWIAVDGYLTVHMTGHATIGAP